MSIFSAIDGTSLIVASSLLVFLADTWLHISTQTVSHVSQTPVSEADLPGYSIQLSKNCTHGLDAQFVGIRVGVMYPGGYKKEPYDSYCAVRPINEFNWLTHPLTVIEVLNNISSSMTISTYYNSTPYTYIGIPPGQIDPNLDFSATSFGVRTQCTPMTKACGMSPKGDFKCNDVFHGNPVSESSDHFQLWSFTNRNMSTHISRMLDYGDSRNPYYTGFAIRTADATNNAQTHDDESIVPFDTGGRGLAFVLACETTAYDVSYDWIDGKVRRFDASTSDITISYVSSPLKTHG